MNPPPLPDNKKKKKRISIFVTVLAIAAILTIGGVVAIRYILTTGITTDIDNKFGDQHLKTAVALLELHKARSGLYPDSLADLKFLGDWDRIILFTVAYYPSADRKSYYVEVTRGWIGKPNFTMPDEFWKGTGFSKELKPRSH